MSLYSGEIITIQLGNYANYVGSHLWNQIESKAKEYTPVFMKEYNFGLGRTETAPRVISYDLKGSLLQSSQASHLDLNSTPCAVGFDTINMTSSAQKPRESTDIPSNWYNLLNNSHIPRNNFNEIKEYCHASENCPFENYEQGDAVGRLPEYAESFEESVRTYAEECNQLQGFQLLIDGNSGFSGFGNTILSFLADEYHSKTKFCLPLYNFADSTQLPKPGTIKQDAYVRCYNWVKAFCDYQEMSSLTMPLGAAVHEPFATELNPIPDLNLASVYESSALLSLAIDSTLLPLYQESDNECNGHTLWSLSQSLTRGSVKISLLDMIFPLPVTVDCSLAKFLLSSTVSSSSSIFHSLNPFALKEDLATASYRNTLAQAAVIRGVSSNSIVFETEKELTFILRNISTVPDVVTVYLQEQHPGSRCSAHSFSNLAFRAPHTFPKLFANPPYVNAPMLTCAITDLPRIYSGLQQPLEILEDRAFKATLPVHFPDVEWDTVKESLDRYVNMMEMYM